MTAVAGLAAVFALLAQSNEGVSPGCLADGTAKTFAAAGCMKAALARLNQPNKPPEQVADAVMQGCQNEVRQLAQSLTICSNNDPANSYPEIEKGLHDRLLVRLREWRAGQRPPSS